MTTAVAVREPAQPHPLLQALEGRRETIAAILPKTMDVDRFIKVAWMACTKNPELLACTPQSLLGSIIEAAELGLEPTGSLNRAWLLPYKVNVAPKGSTPKYEMQAQLMIGYAGLSDLARNNGDVTKIESRVVYEGDTFEARYGTDPGITHLPAFATVDPTKITHVYAIAFFPTEEPQFDVMTREQVDGIRARARGANTGPWSTDYAEQARKTVVRRLTKSLALSPASQDAIQRDIDREVGQIVVGPTVDATAKLRKQLQDRVRPVDAPGAQEPVQTTDAPVDIPPEPDAPAAAGTVVVDPVCGNVAGEGLMEGAVCGLVADHGGAHKNEDGSWPA